VNPLTINVVTDSIVILYTGVKYFLNRSLIVSSCWTKQALQTQAAAQSAKDLQTLEVVVQSIGVDVGRLKSAEGAAALNECSNCYAPMVVPTAQQLEELAEAGAADRVPPEAADEVVHFRGLTLPCGHSVTCMPCLDVLYPKSHKAKGKMGSRKCAFCQDQVDKYQLFKVYL
jgi:hypothetical protein